MSNKLEAERPLSPHLQIYRPMLTMMVSIAHRVSGASLAVGFALLTWWLVAISMGPEAYACVSAFFGSLIGRALLFVFTWALIHHMMGGIRHLIWDTGHGFELATVDRMCRMSLIAAPVATVLIWLLAGGF